jgi:ribonuclease HI
MGKAKFYVVWRGRQAGIFDNWESCNQQVHGVAGAIYKSFLTREEAEAAFRGPSNLVIGKQGLQLALTPEQKKALGSPILESISVDGAWNTGSGAVEYQGVHTATKARLFHVGPLADGTNNIVEFLGIVHALAHCKQNQLLLPIYSDSRNAIAWVRDRQARTKLMPTKRNEKLFLLLERAVTWLRGNDYPNPILKWQTKGWGENPADFGRK